jgi:hypothetical protein
MMKPNSVVTNGGIERILELSVDAHIRRRGTVKDSPEFHALLAQLSLIAFQGAYVSCPASEGSAVVR